MNSVCTTTSVRAALLLAAAAALPATGVAQQSQAYTLSGARIAVYNLAGVIRVGPGTGNDVRVDVSAGGADAGRLTVETGPIGDTETLRIIYPDDRIVYPDRGRHGRSSFRVRDDGTFFGRGGDRGRRVTIRGSGSGLEAYADLTIAVPEGKRVGVYLGVGEVDVRNVNGSIWVDVASAPVFVDGVQGDLGVDTGSGSVEVRNVRGDVEVDTGSGSVELSGANGRSVSIDTGSGSVIASDITAEDLLVDTGSGRITIERSTITNASLDTGSGSVRLELLTDVNNVDIDTGSGSVTVLFPESLGAQLDLESSSGGIDFDVPITVRAFNRSSLRGSIGDGRGLIRVDTGSGSIRFIQR